MATKRITVSVPAEVATRIKRAAGRGHSVSEWVTNSVIRTLDEEDLLRRFLEFCDGVKATHAQEKQAKASFDRITQHKKSAAAKGGRERGKTAA